MVAKEFEDLLTCKQVARALDVSGGTVSYYWRTGILPAVESPMGRLARKQDVEELRRHRAARSGNPNGRVEPVRPSSVRPEPAEHAEHGKRT